MAKGDKKKKGLDASPSPKASLIKLGASIASPGYDPVTEDVTAEPENELSSASAVSQLQPAAQHEAKETPKEIPFLVNIIIERSAVQLNCLGVLLCYK